MAKSDVSAIEILSALTDQYQAPEWIIGYEVGNSTGSEVKRHADAVAINTYPSKGFEIRGFEIKVSKQDLKKELSDGEKADEIARFCNYWFLVTPKGLTADFLIPETWGIIEYNNGKLRQVKKPTYFDAQLKPGFMAAMLRGRDRYYNNNKNQFYQELKKEIELDVTRQYRSELRQYENLKETLAILKEDTGIDLTTWRPEEKVKRAMQISLNIDRFNSITGRLFHDAEDLMEDIEKIKESYSELDNLKCVEGE